MDSAKDLDLDQIMEKESQFSRRNFLKGLGTVVAGLLLATAMPAQAEVLEPSTRDATSLLEQKNDKFSFQGYMHELNMQRQYRPNPNEDYSVPRIEFGDNFPTERLNHLFERTYTISGKSPFRGLYFMVPLSEEGQANGRITIKGKGQNDSEYRGISDATPEELQSVQDHTYVVSPTQNGQPMSIEEALASHVSPKIRYTSLEIFRNARTNQSKKKILLYIESESTQNPFENLQIQVRTTQNIRKIPREKAHLFLQPFNSEDLLRPNKYNAD